MVFIATIRLILFNISHCPIIDGNTIDFISSRCLSIMLLIIK